MAPIEHLSAPPSSGVILTYDYRDSMRHWDIVTQAVCLAISTICILLRMYSKLFIIKAPGWEDWTCCLAWTGLVGYAVISFEADKHGSGIHQWLVAESDIQRFSKVANIAQITYGPLIFITKLSILLLYIRVFAQIKKTTFRIIQLLIWFNFFFYLADTIVKIFECTPRHKIWEKHVDGYCININIPILVTSAVNVASDFMIFLLPIICVWKLQMMKLHKKIGISAIFAAGSFGCISSVVRLVFSVKNSNTSDKTHDWFPEFLWTTAEVTSGIIASCLPALPSCFRYFFQEATTRLSCFSGGVSNGESKSANNNKKPPRIWGSLQQQQRQHPSSSARAITTTKDREILQHSTWELEEAELGDSQIFQGMCYTTAEAKATLTTNNSSSSGEGSPDGSVDIEKAYPPRGILKTVQVDIESSPGQM